MELLAVLCAAIALFEASGVSAQGVVNLTADVTCPQRVVTLTCVTENAPITSLGWTRDNRINLDQPPVGHIIGHEDVYPLQVDVSSVMGILNFTIINASVESGSSNITAELVIDLDVLYTVLGYRSLQCGSAVRDANFSFAAELSIEAPERFFINRVDLFYNATSPGELEELVILTERPVYNCIECLYQNVTYLNTSIAGTVRTIAVNDTNCMEDVCSVDLTDVVDGAGDVDLSVVAGNKYEETTAIPSSLQFSLSPGNSLAFILTSTSDSESTAECTVSDLALDLVNCDVFYGRDSSYQNSQQTQGRFNQPFVISALEANTMYYVEAVFHTRSSSGVDVLYHIRTHFTTGANGSYNRDLAIIVPVIVLLVVMTLTMILLLGFGVHHCFKSNAESQEAAMSKNTAYGQARSQVQPDKDLYVEVS